MTICGGLFTAVVGFVVWVAKYEWPSFRQNLIQSHVERELGRTVAPNDLTRAAAAYVGTAAAPDQAATRIVTNARMHNQHVRMLPDLSVWDYRGRTRERSEQYRRDEAHLLDLLADVLPPGLRIERVAAAQPVFAISLVSIGWDVAKWEEVAAADPYAVLPAADDADGKKLADATGTVRPCVRLDWLVHRLHAAGKTTPAVARFDEAYRTGAVTLEDLAAEIGSREPAAMMACLQQSDDLCQTLGALSRGGPMPRECLEGPVRLYSPFQRLAIAHLGARCLPPTTDQ